MYLLVPNSLAYYLNDQRILKFILNMEFYFKFDF